MIRSWRFLCVACGYAVLLLGLLSCTEGGSSEDGDEDGLPIGAQCVSNPECESRVCYPLDSGSFCTRTCSSDLECAQELGGSCCQKSPTGQTICFPAHLCEVRPDGDMPDGDADGDIPDGDEDGDTDDEIPPTCTAGEKTCQGRNILTCNDDGKGWTFTLACGEAQECRQGQCEDPVDGDQETDGDTEPDNCRPPKVFPSAILYNAELVFNANASNPQAAADGAYSGTTANPINPVFEDGTYVRLNLPGRDAGPLDPEGNPEELAFDLDVDLTYAYSIMVDFVCGVDFGEVELYLNEDTTPLKREEGSQPETYLDLNCARDGIYNERRVSKISYEPICIPEGEHILRARVRGKASASQGYTIGVDYIYVIPDIPDQF